MTNQDDLAVEWSDIEGEGLVRVFPVESFRAGFVLTAHIGLAAEQSDYYPEVQLSARKVIVTIPPHDDGLDHRLAHAIDDVLSNAAES